MENFLETIRIYECTKDVEAYKQAYMRTLLKTVF